MKEPPLVAASAMLPVLAATGPIRFGFLALLVAGALAAWWTAGRSVRPAARPRRFLEHVEELRRRLLVTFGVFLAASAAALFLRVEAWRGVWRPVPAVVDNLAAQVYSALAGRLVPEQVTLVVTGPLDAFMAQVLVGFFLAGLVTLPVALLQAAAFLGPAMRPGEGRVLRGFVAPALLLFALGAAFAFVVVLPFLFTALYAFADPLGAVPLLQVQDFVTFTLGLMLVMGAAFQTPVVMVALSRAGVVPSRTWLRLWRHAVVVILVLAALATDPTLLSQLFVAGPLILLYFIGVGVARWVEPREA